jgi:hypothetical protein
MRPFALLALVSIVCTVLGTAAFVAWLREDVRGTIGTTIRYDDFEFTLVDEREERTLSDGALTAKGVFQIVELEVHDAAKRVDYDLASHRLVCRTPDGATHEPDAAATEAWRRTRGLARPNRLAAGDRVLTAAVFDVPERKPRELWVSFGPFADVVDRCVLGARRFELR